MFTHMNSQWAEPFCHKAGLVVYLCPLLKHVLCMVVELHYISACIFKETFCFLVVRVAMYPPSSLWSLAVCKNGGGRPGIIHHMNDVSVYLGRQRGGGVTGHSWTRSSFLTKSGTLSLCKRSKLQRLGQKQQDQASSSFFWRGTPPPLCLPR